MPKTYAQITKQIEALRAEAEQLRKREVSEVIEKINAAIDAYGITAEDLFGPRRQRASGAASKGSGARAGRQPKYSDGAGNVWGGMGPRPRWLRDAIAGGKSLEDFLTSRSGGGDEAAAPRKAAGKRAGRKAARGASTTRFSDGSNNWSGRGPQPGWLKQALASGKSLDDLRVA
ncbi:H-NS family nucleoid-associated regulatory protein [Piscinibacter koreensis]|uniref:H-NS family nucleoid-associated regulatory protein n=1 Tax=Piscinibacter koreensis TaxID=2742824 RepID=UPI001FE64AA7|nr:H-NS family nucleoid-associated regulatory protein [Schlegelella koreensis]